MSNHNTSHRAAVAALVISSCLWGMAFLFAKLAFAELTVSQVVLYRFGLASLVLLCRLRGCGGRGRAGGISRSFS